MHKSLMGRGVKEAPKEPQATALSPKDKLMLLEALDRLVGAHLIPTRHLRPSVRWDYNLLKNYLKNSS
jgi:hypothetical protein